MWQLKTLYRKKSSFKLSLYIALYYKYILLYYTHYIIDLALFNCGDLLVAITLIIVCSLKCTEEFDHNAHGYWMH